MASYSPIEIDSEHEFFWKTWKIIVNLIILVKMLARLLLNLWVDMFGKSILWKCQMYVQRILLFLLDFR